MAGSKTNYTYRPHPQVSANQMAEYLSATGTRRKSIIREARFPKRSTVARYVIARDCLVDFLIDGTRSLNHMAGVIDRLEKRGLRPGATDWIKQDSESSREAIVKFRNAYNRLGLASLQCEPVHGRLRPLVMGPTKISIALDVLTRKKSMNGADSIGGAVLVFSRGETSASKRVERCKVVAGLIYDFCLKHRNASGVADTSICYGIDVFGGKAYVPPGTFARKRRQIEVCCEEIASRWRDVDPPPDYEGPTPY